MINLYGSIGYTLLNNASDNTGQILVLADMHSQLSYCSNYKKISEWLFSKINNSNILLEEVPRNNLNLKGIFESADHTNDLKNLFLNNPDVIHALDIRPFLIPFSWEVIEFNKDIDIKLKDYLKLVDDFYLFNHPKFKELLDDIYTEKYISNTKLKLHYDVIKNYYLKYKEEYKSFMDLYLFDLYKNNIIILNEFNSQLDNIMEFFILCKIYNLKQDKKNIIIHAGLAHSEKIIFWLENLYDYKTRLSSGHNKIDDLNNKKITNGCIVLPEIIHKQF